MEPSFLQQRLATRKQDGLYRELRYNSSTVDFCSNDYLGVVRNALLPEYDFGSPGTGSTGSRLITGNSTVFEETEEKIAAFHEAEAALIFNSGYDANLGLLSCIGRKGDTILYDSLSHASIRDGVRLSFADSWSFSHNDIQELEQKLKKAQGNIFVVTESVFSMDGDLAPLEKMAELCKHFGAHLIVDEAHAVGVLGQKGEGLAQLLGLHHHCLARIYTYGKAFGSHGASILGSMELRNYLVNFCRSFIYTTALPPSAVQTINRAYDVLPLLTPERSRLNSLIQYFSRLVGSLETLSSQSPIQAVVIPGNEEVRKVSSELQLQGLDVRPILYPTVPKGSERLRIILHAFNTQQEVEHLVETLGRLVHR